MAKTDNDALADAYNRALALEKSGDFDLAATAYAEVLALDPDDHGGAAVRLASMKRGALEYAPIGAVVGVILAAELVLVLAASAFTMGQPASTAMPMPDPAVRHNTAALGDVLYTDYIFFFQIAGIVLLVAMIGAIVLTLRPTRPGVKRQSIVTQVGRKPSDAIEVVDVETGKGL